MAPDLSAFLEPLRGDFEFEVDVMLHHLGMNRSGEVTLQQFAEFVFDEWAHGEAYDVLTSEEDGGDLDAFWRRLAQLFRGEGVTLYEEKDGAGRVSYTSRPV